MNPLIPVASVGGTRPGGTFYGRWLGQQIGAVIL